MASSNMTAVIFVLTNTHIGTHIGEKISVISAKILIGRPLI